MPHFWTPQPAWHLRVHFHSGGKDVHRKLVPVGSTAAERVSWELFWKGEGHELDAGGVHWELPEEAGLRRTCRWDEEKPGVLSVGRGDAEPSAQVAGGHPWNRVHLKWGLSESHSESIFCPQPKGRDWGLKQLGWNRSTCNKKVLAPGNARVLGSHTSNGTSDS